MTDRELMEKRVLPALKTLYNNAELTTLGGMPVLSLGTNSGYFNMGAKVGEVIAALDNFTISTNVYIPTTTSLDGAGNFIYTFSNVYLNINNQAR